ncbi:hypothetical protein CDD81_7822 [Ophiocordyceps australis]|uniref:Uncharacterized protein n=1 Tax=Ophiocordyceps australis TaxID=1399860 RepID=A0A2C5XBK2_9HYPO|nr:hypothetical protein CDD81_7822 [Ophiocordyceps australis]
MTAPHNHTKSMMASDARGNEEYMGDSIAAPTADAMSSTDQDSDMDSDSIMETGPCCHDKQTESEANSMQTEASCCTAACDSQMQEQPAALEGHRADADMKTLCSVAKHLSLSDAPKATEARAARVRSRKSNLLLLRSHLSPSSRAPSPRMTPSWRASKTRQTISRGSHMPELKMCPVDWPTCELSAPCRAFREPRRGRCSLSRRRQRRTEQWLMTLHASTGPEPEQQVAGSQYGIAPVASRHGKLSERRKAHFADCQLCKTQCDFGSDPDMKMGE